MKVVERARVIAVGDGWARVAVERRPEAGSCSGCALAGACGAGAGIDVPGPPPGLAAGQTVTVEVDSPSPATAALVLLILPMLAMLVAGAAAYLATSSGTAGIVSGIAGAAAVFLMVHLVGRGTRVGVRIVTEGRGRSYA